MIAFDLECSRGHKFEGWFENLESFEDQDTKNMISCPHCNDTNIKKVPSSFTMKASSATDWKQGASPIDYRRLAREMVDYIYREFEDLGADFAKEALKIHYGVADERNIRGTATESEENLLEREGIQFFKIPVVKNDDDKKN